MRIAPAHRELELVAGAVAVLGLHDQALRRRDVGDELPAVDVVDRNSSAFSEPMKSAQNEVTGRS